MQESVTAGEHHTPLWTLVDQLFGEQQLILASNRGPVEYHLKPGGSPQVHRGSGGVVTALSGLTNHVEFTWIASAMGEGDRRVAQEHGDNAIRSPLPDHRVSIRYVNASRRVYHKYYNVICNPLLWFLQHYMWDSAYSPRIDASTYDAWENGYAEVNRKFAEAIVDEAGKSNLRPLVMVHDYHLYLVPGLVRLKIPHARIHQFIHVPWPSSSYWKLLPSIMRTSICSSLCEADIVGFQTDRDVRSFLECCEAFLPTAHVDHVSLSVSRENRKTLIRTYPISIDVEEVRTIAVSQKAQLYERRLRSMLGKQTIIRVDRAEPSKNIVRGFNAYATLLEQHVELHGKVKFLAFLVPSRTHIGQYRRYQNAIESVISEINQQYGTNQWQPVEVFFENNYIQAIAAMKLYDVLLVNSVIDGMNLVAKEGPVVNTRNGVVVLSEAAGAHTQLQSGCLSVAPADVEGTHRALYQALMMSAEERETKSRLLIQTIEKEDILNWLYSQLLDIRALAQ